MAISRQSEQTLESVKRAAKKRDWLAAMQKENMMVDISSGSRRIVELIELRSLSSATAWGT